MQIPRALAAAAGERSGLIVPTSTARRCGDRRCRLVVVAQRDSRHAILADPQRQRAVVLLGAVEFLPAREHVKMKMFVAFLMFTFLTLSAHAQQLQPYAPPDQALWNDLKTALSGTSMPLPSYQQIQTC